MNNKDELNPPKQCGDDRAQTLRRTITGGLAVAYTIGTVSVTLSGCGINQTDEDSSTATGSSNSIKQEEQKKQNEEELFMAEQLSEDYTNKAVRALESTRIQLGEEKYSNIVSELGNAEDAQSQGDYVADLLDNLNSNDGENAATTVMRACGYNCIDDTIVATVKRLYAKSENIEELLQTLNSSGIGGGQLSIEENKITAIYDNCYCDIDEGEKKLPKCYCQCSCGWFEKLFATVLNQSVEVELKQSIKDGAETCIFEISI